MSKQARIAECFSYDEASGMLRWKERPLSHFKNERARKIWNTRYSGSDAGSVNKANGVRVILFDGSIVAAHRLVWELHNGPIPEGREIDHINQDRLDNRLSNLRLATRGENLSNRSTQSNCKAGVKGVVFDARKKKNPWAAFIRKDRKTVYLGVYPTKGLAACAYAKASIAIQGRFSVFCRKLVSDK